MDRRSFLSGAAAASLAFAATASAEEHHHHAHGAAAANPNDALIKATAACLSAGRACLAHCIRLLSEGDKSMADCAKAVNQMLALLKRAALKETRRLAGFLFLRHPHRLSRRTRKRHSL